MKQDIKLTELFIKMEQALKEKAKVEKVQEKAEIRRRKWQTEILHLKDILAHKEYSL